MEKLCVKALQNSLGKQWFSSQGKLDQFCTTVRKLVLWCFVSSTMKFYF